MHIPSEMLSGAVCPVSAALAATGVAASAYALAKGGKAPSALKFSLVSATVFGLQMLNYPVWSGISGHLIGGVFAASLLGIPAAILSLSIVLILQTLMFADGGILMLGANVLNMALLGAGLGGAFRAFLMRKKLGESASTALAAFVSVELAAFALCAELLASGKGGVQVFATLIGVHTALAAVEAGATAALCRIVGSEDSAAASRRSYAVLGVMIVAALALSPLASAFPDAFEWTMQSFALLPDAPNFAGAPFADYAAFGGEGALSTLLAGAIGAAATFALSFAAAKALSKSAARV